MALRAGGGWLDGDGTELPHLVEVQVQRGCQPVVVVPVPAGQGRCGGRWDGVSGAAIARSNWDVRSDFCVWFCVFCTVDMFHVECVQTHLTCFVVVTQIP